MAVQIESGVPTELPGSGIFRSVISLAVSGSGNKALVSATLAAPGGRCGLFQIDLKSRQIDYLLENVKSGCHYLSSWTELSLSPDGTHAVGTAQKGQLGLIDLKERRIVRLWPGTEAYWSPDGKWIAALTFSDPMRLEILEANDTSKRRLIETADREMGHVAWSPDSRYLLLWATEARCGLGVGYYGTLNALDIKSGVITAIDSSRCKVNLASTGWVAAGVPLP